MNGTILTSLTLLVIFATWSSAWPLYEEDEQFMYDEPQEYVRERRSPDEPNKGDFGLLAKHITGNGNGGYVRGDYNHKLWQGSGGARLDGTAHYQRNWGQPGPRQDYYGGVKLTVPLGRN